MQTEVRRNAEYDALRATIRERGTARMVLIPFVFTAWAGVAIATSAVIAVALSTLVPLLVLAAGFEATFALYTNVERIGRYLQVFHERDATIEWEHVSMEFGRRFSDGGPDPLFARLFITAVSVNFLPVTLGRDADRDRRPRASPLRVHLPHAARADSSTPAARR